MEVLISLIARIPVAQKPGGLKRIFIIEVPYPNRALRPDSWPGV